ncbi:MAG: hypothetical protein ACJ8CR_27140 [Roseiflexaceae bacterium]
MTTLSLAEAGELHLTLRGAEENRILTTVRRWPYWQRVDIERDPANAERCLSVTLVADRVHESTVRMILSRSFGLTFPDTGGSREIGPEPPASPRRRGR